MSRLVIDTLESLTNWTHDDGLTLELCGFPEYAADYRTNSVAIKIPAGSKGKTAILTLPASIDVSDYDELVIGATSLRTNVNNVEKDSDAKYIFSVASGKDFSVPVANTYTGITIPIDGYTEVTQLKIIINHDNADYLILSGFSAVKDTFPSDILDGIKTGIETERDRIGIKEKIGTVTASAGARYVTVLTDWSYLERNVVLLIGNETHQIDNIADNKISFKSTYDGISMLNNVTNADVYVTIPVEIGYYDRDAKLPGIVVWYASPTPATRNSRAELKSICVGPDGIYQKRDGFIEKWTIQLEVVARDPFLENLAAQAVRTYLSTSLVWCTGHRLWFEWSDPAVDNEPVESYDIVPRASYNFDVEIREDTWQTVQEVQGSPQLQSVTIQ